MENTENTAVAIYGVDINLTPATFADESCVSQIVQTVAQVIKEQAAAIDITNTKELKKLGGLAREVSGVKSRIEEYGKSLVEDTKRQLKVVDNGRALFKQQFDALRDEVRQPLTDFENAEKARIQAKDDAVRLCSKHKEFLTPSADELKGFLAEVEALNPADYAEFAQQITVERQTAIDALKLRIEKQEEIDRQAEENARLKAEAEKARIEQEKQAYAEEQARKAVEMERQRKEQEERQKSEEQARIQAEEERRKADIEHRRTINNKIVADLMTHCGVNEETAKNIVTHIVEGNIANVCVNY